MTTSKAAFKPGWKEIRHEAKIQPSKERLAYERVQVHLLSTSAYLFHLAARACLPGCNAPFAQLQVFAQEAKHQIHAEERKRFLGDKYVPPRSAG